MLADQLLHQFFTWMAELLGLTNQEVAAWTLLGFLGLVMIYAVLRRADIY